MCHTINNAQTSQVSFVIRPRVAEALAEAQALCEGMKNL